MWRKWHDVGSSRRVLMRLALAVALAVIIGVVVAAPKLMNTRTDTMLRQPVPEPPRVRVQQTLVRPIEVVETRQSPRPSRTAVAAVRSPSSKPQPATFVARAARTLVGDGRYRPEPFPRAR